MTEVAGEDVVRVQLLERGQNQEQCTHSEKARCCRLDTRPQNVNHQTRTVDQHCQEHTEEVQVDHAFARLAHRTMAQQTFRKRRTHASCPEWTNIQMFASFLRRTEHLFLYCWHEILARERNQRVIPVRVEDASDLPEDS